MINLGGVWRLMCKTFKVVKIMLTHPTLSSHTEREKLNIKSLSWSVTKDFPHRKQYYRYSIISMLFFFILSGYKNIEAENSMPY